MLDLEEIDLFTAWERGRVASGCAGSALALLAAAYPDHSPASLAQLSIGERDTLLLTLRERLFGSRMHCLSNCAGCNETLAIELDVQELRVSAVGNSTIPMSIDEEDYVLNFRLPNTYDLLAIAGAGTVSAGRLLLLDRLIISATHKGTAVAPDKIPASILSRMESSMADAEPQADLQLNFVCDVCRCRNLTVFDIASFLWTEVEVWAIRTLREIHELARAYGWGEAEILHMSPWRRRCYMELLGI
jgi:hypothetical protein